MIRRRIVKTVTASADFDRTEYYYYAGYRVIETRNGSEQTIMQVVFGTRYMDPVTQRVPLCGTGCGAAGQRSCRVESRANEPIRLRNAGQSPIY